MAGIEVVSLKPLRGWHGYYFVGPETGGPALTMRVFHNGEISTRLSSHIHDIGRYARLPRVGEEYGDWLHSSGGEDMLHAHVERRLMRRIVADGRPLVRHSLEVRPVLSDPVDVLKTARILGRQLLASREDPSTPVTLIDDIGRAGISCDSAIVTTELLSNQEAQNYPLF